ncbi:DUF6542 domain-containing protein [Gordonia sp. NPDC003504]
MPFPQRSSSAVPLDQQSVLPTVRGVPWWGAVLIATILTAIGAVIDAKNNDSLGATFNFCLLVGCCLAALAVRRRALFTAAAQPPLIAFVVGMLALYGLNADDSSGLRSLVLKVLLPIAANFPWMAITFVVTLILVLLRWYLTRPASTPTPTTAKRTPTRRRASGSPAPEAQPGRRTRARADAAGQQSPRPDTVRAQKSSATRASRAGERPRRRRSDEPTAVAATASPSTRRPAGETPPRGTERPVAATESADPGRRRARSAAADLDRYEPRAAGAAPYRTSREGGNRA